MSVFQLFAARTPFVDSRGHLTTQALKALQALVQATGGNASGVVPPPGNVTIIEIEANLEEVEAEIDATQSEVANNKAWLAVFEATHGSVAADVSRIDRKVRQPQNTELLIMLGEAMARISELERKLKKLETQCQSSLAR